MLLKHRHDISTYDPALPQKADRALSRLRALERRLKGYREAPKLPRKKGAPHGLQILGEVYGTVGQAGPLMSAYALASKWPLPAFVASMQVCWFVVNAGAAALKGPPPVPVLLAVVLLGALAVGLVASIPIARAVPRSVVLRFLTVVVVVVAVAVAGSVAVLAHGVGSLVWPMS